MVAIVGLPGSAHHTWRWFPRGGTINGETAAQWTRRVYAETLERNPALGAIETEIISDRKALKRRWRDGRRIYPVDTEEGRYEELS